MSRRHVVTFEQVNRIYAASSARAAFVGYPLMAWYRGACEFVTGMREPIRPDAADAAANSAFHMGAVGHVPEILQKFAGNKCDVTAAEIDELD